MTEPVENQNRAFQHGEEVRIAKKTHVVDRDRAHEGQAPGVLPPIEQDMTGSEGRVDAQEYYSEEKGEVFVPIRLRNEAVISVPESRLERVGPSGHRKDGGGQSGVSGVSAETLEFWRKVFENRDKDSSQEKGKSE